MRVVNDDLLWDWKEKFQTEQKGLVIKYFSIHQIENQDLVCVGNWFAVRLIDEVKIYFHFLQKAF